jgi:hypothetical protein
VKAGGFQHHFSPSPGDAHITSKLLLFGADPSLKDMWLGISKHGVEAQAAMKYSTALLGI